MIINSINWKIEMNDSLPENIFGQTNYALCKIYLNPSCDKVNLERTLLHEIMHAYIYSYGLHFIETFDRETICEFISHNFGNIRCAYSCALQEVGL